MATLRYGFVRCRHCQRRLEIDAHGASRIRDEFSLQCPSCWRRYVYTRDDLEFEPQRRWVEAG